MMNKKKLSNELNKVAIEIERTYLISKEDDTQEGNTFSSYPSTYHYGNEEEEDKTLEDQYKKLHEKMKGEEPNKEEVKDEEEANDEEEEDLAAKTEQVEKKIETLEKRVGKTAKDDSDIMTVAAELRNMADKLETSYRTMLQGSRFN